MGDADCEAVLREISRLTTEVSTLDEKLVESSALQAALSAEAEQAGHHRTQLNEPLRELARVAHSTCTAVEGLSRIHINEVRGLSNPPALVRRTIEMVYHLFHSQDLARRQGAVLAATDDLRQRHMMTGQRVIVHSLANEDADRKWGNKEAVVQGFDEAKLRYNVKMSGGEAMVLALKPENIRVPAPQGAVKVDFSADADPSVAWKEECCRMLAKRDFVQRVLLFPDTGYLGGGVLGGGEAALSDSLGAGAGSNDSEGSGSEVSASRIPTAHPLAQAPQILDHLRRHYFDERSAPPSAFQFGAAPASQGSVPPSHSPSRSPSPSPCPSSPPALPSPAPASPVSSFSPSGKRLSRRQSAQLLLQTSQSQPAGVRSPAARARAQLAVRSVGIVVGVSVRAPPSPPRSSRCRCSEGGALSHEAVLYSNAACGKIFLWAVGQMRLASLMGESAALLEDLAGAEGRLVQFRARRSERYLQHGLLTDALAGKRAELAGLEATRAEKQMQVEAARAKAEAEERRAAEREKQAEEGRALRQAEAGRALAAKQRREAAREEAREAGGEEAERVEVPPVDASMAVQVRRGKGEGKGRREGPLVLAEAAVVVSPFPSAEHCAAAGCWVGGVQG
jgi:hypothetical protein